MVCKEQEIVFLTTTTTVTKTITHDWMNKFKSADGYGSSPHPTPWNFVCEFA